MITTVVLAGGGIRGILQLGCLYYLYKNNYLSNTTTYCGTSIGSITCYALILGYTPINILSYICCNKPIQGFEFNIFSLLTNFGLFNWELIEVHLRKLTLDKLDHIPTLKQLYEKYKKKLICVTYNQSKQKIEYISKDTHPELSCLIALRMSCNLPLLFHEFIYNNNIYIDGGIADNFAIGYIDSITPPEEYIIGIDLNNEVSRDPTNIIEYIQCITNIPLQIIKKLRKINSKRVKIIILKSLDISIFDYDITIIKSISLFSEGYFQTKKIFD